MNQEELSAQTEAAFAIERERSAVLRALIVSVGAKDAHDLWTNGFAAGRAAGMQIALDIIAPELLQ